MRRGGCRQCDSCEARASAREALMGACVERCGCRGTYGEVMLLLQVEPLHEDVDLQHVDDVLVRTSCGWASLLYCFVATSTCTAMIFLLRIHLELCEDHSRGGIASQRSLLLYLLLERCFSCHHPEVATGLPPSCDESSCGCSFPEETHARRGPPREWGTSREVSPAEAWDREVLLASL